MISKIFSLTELFTQHSFIRYLLVGGTTFALDFFGLVFLHDILGINVLVAASISYWLSIAFNFTTNRLWTFGSKDKANLAKHLALYLALLGFNYLFTIGFIALTTHLGMHYTVSKILAVSIQITWTYVIYKKIIFK